MRIWGDRHGFTQLDLDCLCRKGRRACCGREFHHGIDSRGRAAQTHHRPVPRDTAKQWRVRKRQADLRFGMEIIDLGPAVRNSEFRMFSETLQDGGVVRCIVAPGCASYSRKDIDVITDLVKGAGAKGLGTLAWTSDGIKGTVAKSVKPDEAAEIARITGAREGDLVCIVADKEPAVCKGLGALVWLSRQARLRIRT